MRERLRDLFDKMGAPGPDHSGQPPFSADLPPAPIEQKPLLCLDQGAFRTDLRRKLEDLLSVEPLKPAVAALSPPDTEPSAPRAAAELMAFPEPIDALNQWTSVAHDLLGRVAGRSAQGSVLWRELEKVHLALLPWLVDERWLADWIARDGSGEDRLLFRLAVRHKSPNRSVEVLMARLNRKGGIQFEHFADRNPREAVVPALQVDTGTE